MSRSRAALFGAGTILLASSCGSLLQPPLSPQDFQSEWKGETKASVVANFGAASWVEPDVPRGGEWLFYCVHGPSSHTGLALVHSDDPPASPLACATRDPRADVCESVSWLFLVDSRERVIKCGQVLGESAD